MAALARRQPPYQGAATPAVGVAAPASGRVGRERQPLAGAQQPAPLAAPANDAGLPCGLALVAAGYPLAGGLGRDLTVGGRPCMGTGRGWPPLLLAAFDVKA
ncbi:hypothetical protein GW17_00056931 [Ensete ventricosum]|nr:hypothetical protein GW17_00056931 [Ensete ventricosum]